MDYQRPLFHQGYGYVNITTSAIVNTAVAVTFMAAVAATEARRIQVLAIAGTQGNTGNIMVTFDDTLGFRLAVLSISPQTPYAQLVIPSPGYQLTDSAGLVATHISNVANQGLRISYADVFDIKS